MMMSQYRVWHSQTVLTQTNLLWMKCYIWCWWWYYCGWCWWWLQASISCCIVEGLYLNPFIAAGQMMMMIIICQMIMMMKTMNMTTMMMMMMIVCMFCCITWPLHARARFNCCGTHIDCTSMRKVIVMMIRGRRRMTTAMMMTTATMMGILTCQKSGIIW